MKAQESVEWNLVQIYQTIQLKRDLSTWIFHCSFVQDQFLERLVFWKLDFHSQLYRVNSGRPQTLSRGTKLTRVFKFMLNAPVTTELHGKNLSELPIWKGRPNLNTLGIITSFSYINFNNTLPTLKKQTKQHKINNQTKDKTNIIVLTDLEKTETKDQTTW